MAPSMTTTTITANGVEFAAIECGVGPLALCLHGFPDSAQTWRHLLPALAEAGFRSVAPFMRGYAPTSVPEDGRFQVGALARDANSLHEQLGGDGDAVLVGHDWGAAAVYAAAGSSPQRWRGAVGMSVPPGPVLGAALASNVEQIKRSWYMFFFQLSLAEVVLPANDLAMIDTMWADWSPGYDGQQDAQRAKRCLRDPKNLAAALGYYRAAFGSGPRDPELDDVEAAGAVELSCPTLYLHGDQDGCIGPEVAASARTMCPWASVEIIEGAGHFLHLERPDDVNTRVCEFLTSSDRPD